MIRRENNINTMLDEHLERKHSAQREELHRKKREELHRIERATLPEDAIIIRRKDMRSFLFGGLTGLLILAIIGTAFATMYAGTQTLDMGAQKITNLATPAASTDAATKAYVDAATDQNCTPEMSNDVSASTTTYVTGTICTSCSGWLSEVYIDDGSSTTGGGTAKIEVDGVNSSGTGVGIGGTTILKTYSRFKSSLRVSVMDTGDGITVSHVIYCRTS